MNSIQHGELTPQQIKNKTINANRSKEKNANHHQEGVYNLDNEGVSQLTYPNEEG